MKNVNPMPGGCGFANIVYQKVVEHCAIPNSIIELGCGEGYLTEYVRLLQPISTIMGVDISEDVIELAVSQYPHISFQVASVNSLPFQDNSFDLVLACELLEHLELPRSGLDEIQRICKKYILFSVPREPIWRLLNMSRLRYLKNFGNTPGHLNHWSKRQFQELLSQRFEVEQVRSPLPWTVVLCRKRATVPDTMGMESISSEEE